MIHMNQPVASVFLSGGLVVGYWTAGFFFRRFWKKSGDRLFHLFNWALWILAIERIWIVMVSADDAVWAYPYVLRLTAFGLIVLAIVNKNRQTR